MLGFRLAMQRRAPGSRCRASLMAEMVSFRVSGSKLVRAGWRLTKDSKRVRETRRIWRSSSW